MSRRRPSPPNPPVVGGVPARHSGKGNKPIRRVVVHSAVMPCEPGRARQLGRMNQSGSTGGSWHYATDPAETIQCSWDSYVCHHAPPNANSIGIEMADWPAPVPAKLTVQAFRAWRWRGRRHKLMLERTAVLVAELCAGYGLPPSYLNHRALRRNPKAVGWTTHRQVSLAFRQSSHWDPGFWPLAKMKRRVRFHYNRLMED